MKIGEEIMMISMVESEKEYNELMDILENCSRFAFYCASIDYRKNSQISLAAIFAESKGMFVFDAQIFGLDDRFQACFSNPSIIKIMFDCRRDSDSLYYAYGTVLNGVVDLQIMDYVIKHSEKPGEPIGSLLSTVEEYFGCFAGRKLKGLKKKMAEANEQEYDWLDGPSRDDMIEYLTEEIRWFFPLFYELTAKYKKDLPKLTPEKVAEIQFYSSMYSASSSRSSASSQTVQDDPYQNHQFMPWGIFQPRPIGSHQCTGCKLSFPSKDCQDLHFDPGRPKCTVCKAVKLSLLEAKEGKIIPPYNPDLEHVSDLSACSGGTSLPRLQPESRPVAGSQRDAESETETDDSGIWLPDRVASYGGEEMNVSIRARALRNAVDKRYSSSM